MKFIKEIESLPLDKKVKRINEIKLELHRISPFKDEPVDCVVWVKKEEVVANDYNPNSVAPPEMELLKTSILNDGYTQPIVTFKELENFTVIDGFHRNKVGKECQEVTEKISGYLPIVIINQDREDKADRMASTIRHNRARGKHKIDAMSDIIIELKKRCWNDKKISKELGMEEDEVLRLAQISGLSEIFQDKEFSLAWEIQDELDVEEIDGLE